MACVVRGQSYEGVDPLGIELQLVLFEPDRGLQSVDVIPSVDLLLGEDDVMPGLSSSLSHHDK